jgi:outer membrane protein OmpA-like peptidoglycan-associated protein
MQAHPDARLIVEGYADATGPEEYNLVLSYRRAVAVASLLVEAEIEEARIATRAYGEETGPTLGDGQQRRRVTVRIEGLDECAPTPQLAEMN